MRARYLIVNADDLGFTTDVTRGIIDAHQKGIVTSASVMVNMAGSEESIASAMENAPRLGLGLHLNLTSGSALSRHTQVNGFIENDGSFTGKSLLFPNLKHIDMRFLVDELHSQLDRFSLLAGRKPDHVDSHHHITYAHPELASAMCNLALELEIPVRRPFNQIDSDLANYLIESGTITQHDEALNIAEDVNATLEKSGIIMPDYFCHTFFGDHVALGDLLNALVDMPAGTSELMCHPGYVDEALRKSSRYADNRLCELETLTQPAAREVLVSENITLTNFGHLVQ